MLPSSLFHLQFDYVDEEVVIHCKLLLKAEDVMFIGCSASRTQISNMFSQVVIPQTVFSYNYT